MKNAFKKVGIATATVVGIGSFFAIPFALNLNSTEASLDGRAQYDPTDTDGDGMSDQWEVEFFGSIAARDGSEDDDLDDLSNLDEWLGGTDPLFLNPHSVGESGYVDIHSNERGQYFTVRLDGVYSNPVVVVGPASSNALAPMTIRVKDVTASSFDLAIEDYIDRATLIDGYHPEERVSWIVVEAGTHTLPSGQLLQAGYGQVSHNFQEIAFNEEFTTIPTVFSQVTSINGSLALATRHQDIDLDSFSALIQTQENINNTSLSSETLSWIAIEDGVTEVVSGQVQVGKTRENTTHVWRNMNFAVTQPEDPSFFCMMQTTNGIDTSNIRYRNLGPLSAQVQIDEEGHGDREVGHRAAESVGFLVATPGMFHVLATTGDQDADGIADDYELANGLIVGEIDYYKDLDGDGLTNAEEAIAGTRADLVDSDGDGVSDYDEVNFFNSDALATDVGFFTLTKAISGADFNASEGEWKTENSFALQNSTRGSIKYDLNIASPTVYSVEVDVQNYRGAQYSDDYDFVISVDGHFVSREKISMSEGEVKTLKVLTPYLNTGEHEVEIFIDNSYTFRRAAISEVRLLSASGVDSNDNQTPDWVEIRTANNNGLNTGFSESKTSPVCLEGIAKYFGLIEADLDLKKTPNNGWYANLTLDQEQATDLEIFYENGALAETTSIEWVTTNLFSEGDLTIRQGDSLKLTAYDSGSPDSSAYISVEGQGYEVDSQSFVVHEFNTPGEQSIYVDLYEGSSILSYEVKVNVVPLVTMDSPICIAGWERPWSVDVPDTAVVQIDDSVAVFNGQKTDSGYSYTIATEVPESGFSVARIGYNGPILGSTVIRSSTVKSAGNTSVFIVETINDAGTQKLLMPVVVNNPYDDLEIHTAIHIAGVTFPDTSTSNILTGEDFDELGNHTLEFLKPATTSSNCHRMSVWHNGVRIAYLF